MLPLLAEMIYSNGYLYLFLLSFLAATVLPLGSEWLLAALLLEALDPLTLLAAATAGNFLGACTTYAIGIFGGPFLTEKVLRVGETAKLRAEKLYARYGYWSLLFSWLPVVGDPLCLVGGLFKIPFRQFSVLVFTGKLARYAIVEMIVLKLV